MKKVLIATLATVLALASFTACDNKKGDDDKGMKVDIPGNVEDADDVVKVVAVLGDDDVIATATLSKGKFVLTLPETVADSKLRSIENNLPDGMTLSVADAKISIANIFGVDADDEEIGMYYAEFETDTRGVYLAYMYSNKVVKVTGTDEDTDGYKEIYDIDLKKGWNYVYEIGVDDEDTGETTVTYTTTKPADAIAWMFDPN